MCTVVVAASVFPGLPLVVVANRDERLGRPSSPPSVWPAGFLAPRDEEAHGTWLGINRFGVFVGITNRYLASKDPSRVSRGALVTDALALPSARAIHERMSAVPADRHNGFHLVYADANDVLATICDGVHIAQLTLGKGKHVVTERSFGAGDASGRLARIERAWSRLTPAPSDANIDTSTLAERLSPLLTEHDPSDPLGSTCIHLPVLDYGTRSAMVLTVDRDLPKSRMLWAEGPPCTTPFAAVDLEPLFR